MFSGSVHHLAPNGDISDQGAHPAAVLFAGPGKAWSAKEQGEYLFKLAGKKEKYVKAPIALMDGIIGFFDFLSKAFPALEVSGCQSLPSES